MILSTKSNCFVDGFVWVVHTGPVSPLSTLTPFQGGWKEGRLGQTVRAVEEWEGFSERQALAGSEETHCH